MSAHTLADDSHLSECLRSGLGTGSMTRFEEVAMDAPGGGGGLMSFSISAVLFNRFTERRSQTG